jgi:hypothetical protein
MPLPTFFIIGAPKTGTTSLHSYLDSHPEVQMSANKEPRYFAGPENGIPHFPGRVVDREAYEALFDPAFAVRGEASTDYAIHPRRTGVPERIAELVPEAKFIYVVRDPIERTISHYRMRVAVLGERRSLEEALHDFTDVSSPYVWPSLYASQLELYVRHFPHERVLVVDQADLLVDRRESLREMFAFLGVEDGIDAAQFDEVLSRTGDWRVFPTSYLRAVDRFVVPITSWIPQGARRSVRRVVERTLWPAVETPALGASLRARLTELYAGEVERLRAMTGKAFATWSV